MAEAVGCRGEAVADGRIHIGPVVVVLRRWRELVLPYCLLSEKRGQKLAVNDALQLGPDNPPCLLKDLVVIQATTAEGSTDYVSYAVVFSYKEGVETCQAFNKRYPI